MLSTFFKNMMRKKKKVYSDLQLSLTMKLLIVFQDSKYLAVGGSFTGVLNI